MDRRVESVRSFDAETQRSGERLPRVDLLPAREFGLGPDSVRDFRRRFRTRFEGDLTRMPLYRDVGEGLAPAGIEYYLPLFFEATSSLFDYLPAGAVVALPADYRRTLDCGVDVGRGAIRGAPIRHRAPGARARRSLPAAAGVAGRTRCARPDCCSATATTPRRRRCRTPVVEPADRREAPALRLDQRREESIKAFAAHLAAHPGRVLLAAESPGRRELLLDLLRPHGVDGPRGRRDGTSSWRATRRSH